MPANPPDDSDRKEQFGGLIDQSVDTDGLAPVLHKSTYSPTILDAALSLDAVAEADSREILDAAKQPPDWTELDKAADALAEGIRDALVSVVQATLNASVATDEAVITDN